MVEGSLEQPDLGISEENLQSITNNVAVVFHIAATVKFDAHIRCILYCRVSLLPSVVCRHYPCYNVSLSPSIMRHVSMLTSRGGWKCFSNFYNFIFSRYNGCDKGRAQCTRCDR